MSTISKYKLNILKIELTIFYDIEHHFCLYKLKIYVFIHIHIHNIFIIQ